MLKLNLKKCCGVLEYMMTRNINDKLEGAYLTIMEANSHDLKSQKKIEKFRKFSFLRKGFFGLKIHLQATIREKQRLVRQMEHDREHKNNSMATDFYQFSLKMRAFDSLVKHLDMVQEYKERIEGEGLMTIKVESFKDKINQLKDRISEQTEEDTMTESEFSDFNNMNFTLPAPMVKPDFDPCEESLELERMTTTLRTLLLD